jgi:hypothetical protein
MRYLITGAELRPRRFALAKDMSARGYQLDACVSNASRPILAMRNSR